MLVETSLGARQRDFVQEMADDPELAEQYRARMFRQNVTERLDALEAKLDRILAILADQQKPKAQPPKQKYRVRQIRS